MLQLFSSYEKIRDDLMLMLLALLDILGGLTLAFSWTYPFVYFIGLLILVKGLFSLAGSLTSGHYFDWMGWVDIIAGIMLIFGFGISWFWVLPVLKGCYSLLFSIFR